MELLFIYVDWHKNIRDKGFNFGHEFYFSINKLKNQLHLSIETRDNNIPEGFFGERIVNVSAIIGENGTGKTHLIEILRSERLPTLEIWKRLDGNFYYHLDNEFRLEKLDLIIPEEYKNRFYDTHEPCFTRNVFYSSIVDFRNFPILKDPDDIDVSTNNLIDKDGRDESSAKRDYDKIIFHKIRDIQRQIELIKSRLMPSKAFNISLPHEIEISITDIVTSDPEWNLDFNSRSVRKILFDKLRDEINKNIHIDRKTELDSIKEDAKLNRAKFSFLKNIVEAYFYSRNLTNHFLEIELGIDEEKLSEQNWEDALILFATTQNWIDQNILKGYFKAVINLFNEAQKEHYLINHSKFSSVTVPFDSDVFISIQSFQISFLNEILNNNNHAGVIQPFDFMWRNMSSGELAVLNLFSRLLYAKRLIIERIENPDLILEKADEIRFISIQIDEGEVGFHPDWQKKYLSTLISFLPVCFYHEKYMKETKLQLFLTSHSAFLISDLPKQNVIFLNKTKDNFLALSDLFDHQKTFGSNIHTLYSDAFFMKDGLIGDFAKDRIQSAICFLKEKNLKDTYWTKEKVEKLISLIGEPLIAERLERLYDEKYKTKEDIEKRIEVLRIELKKLTDEKNSD